MFVSNYVKLHDIRGAFDNKNSQSGVYINVEGWKDYAVGNSLVFSHRENFYTKQTFTEGMHSHEYYELLIYLSGAVEYINESSSFKPNAPCAVWFKPGQMHTARLLYPSNYERVVLYFDKDFFAFEDSVTPIIDFTLNEKSFAMDLEDLTFIKALLVKIKSCLELNSSYNLLSAKTFITELFLTLNCTKNSFTSKPLTDDISKIKNYIDTCYSSICSINDIAKRFYISREHLSRQFKKKFNINVSNYLTQRRITESIKLLKTDDVTTSAYAVGFNSMSAYISAFKFCTGLTPSQYKKNNL